MFRQLIIGTAVFFSIATYAVADQPRVRQNFDFDWKFFKGDATGADQPAFDDSAWRKLDLPHDWSIEGPWEQNNPTGGPGGFVPAGVGWYRKIFTLPESQKNKRFLIEFDGVYMNSEVWLNGQSLGSWPYGYTSFAYELPNTVLKFGDQPNVIAVRADNSKQPGSRYYSGSGIDRNVWLTVTEPVHIAHWGTYVTYPKATAESATVRVRTTIQNDGADQNVALTTQLVDRDGTVVGTTSSDSKNITTGATVELDQNIDVATPQLWSVDSPTMYMLHSLVKIGDQVVDDYPTPIGIRDIAYDLNRGFLLNGKPLKMRGVCIHHEGGSIGSAVPEGVWARRLQILKDMGCTAIRTSHNPFDPVFLDLCDRMGFVVMDEAFDEWTVRKPQIRFGYSDYFNDWYEKDVTSFVRRDRNHPSVVMWSAGNEIGEQRAPTGPAVLKKLVDVFHREDSTRPVTAGMDNVYTDRGNAPEAFTDLLDIVGYNYVDRWGTRRETYYADDRSKYPNRKFVGTESSSIGGVRDQYTLPLPPSQAAAAPAPATLPTTNPAAGRGGRGARGAGFGGGGFGARGSYATSMIRTEQLWKFIETHDYVIGDFMWTGVDYLGETGWPRKGSGSGQIDTAGFPKDAYYFFQSIWTTKPVLHLFPHWNWPGREGAVIPVVAYTNCDTVELLLNGKSFGAKSIEFPRQGNAGSWNSYARPYVPGSTADLHLTWDVPYAAGTLKAIGRKNGQVVAETEVKTTAAPAALVVSVDHSTIRADARDVAHFTVKVVDKDGLLVPGASPTIAFDLQGPARMIGTDNGDLSDLTSPTSKERKAYNGMALAIVQSQRQAGQVRMTVRAEGLTEATVLVNAEMPR